MDSPGPSEMDFDTARALLEWQVEMGADEAICEAPLDRYALEAAPEMTPAPETSSEPAAATEVDAEVDAVAAAKAAAEGVDTLEGLAEAQRNFDLCELRKGARNFVFADGDPAARVMVIGEAPGRDEDIAGRPFVGRAGQLLDRMFAAIGLARTGDGEGTLYIANVMPWRPPSNREPTPEEIAMMLPFVRRHVELAAPDVVVLMGNISCDAALGRRGILRLRGTWVEAYDRPAMPMTHPAYLLRNPAAKKEAWADLLAIKARLRGEG